MNSSSKNTNRNELMFNQFCSLCDQIGAALRAKKSGILQKFISEYKTNNEVSFYRVLRLLLPQLDRERAAYGIKEFTLAKKYVRILCLDPESPDALKLKNFRAPKNAGNNAGDFGEVAYWVLKSRCDSGNEFTLDDVHQHLDAIALRHAEKKPREVEKELEVMLRRMSAQEQKWLIRILLKDMRLGLGTGRVLSAYHPDAKELYDFTNSLQQVCEKLSEPSRRLHEVEVSLFTPCRPMLAERCDVQHISKHWTRRPGPRYVETKLDGERSQLHYASGQFKFYSRNAFEFTDSFGATSQSGSLTPHLAKQLKPEIKNCILDGEMMPWNTKYKCFGSKGMNLDVKSLRVGNVHQPCFCVFDILYLNDRVLTNQPLSQRLAALEQVFTEAEGIMMQPPRTVVNNSEEVLDALNRAIDNLEEGLVVKEPESIYKPNSRRDGWIKIKPEYTAGAMVELDMLIIGGYYGEGRRRGLVSHFLLGVAQPPPQPGQYQAADGVALLHPGGVPEVFDSVARVGSGCTMDELAALARQLEPHWHRVQHPNTPPGLRWTRERPTLWLEPGHSVILQVKASEIVRSDFYQTGYTLRFPRIEKVRYDKPWSDCLTTTEFTNLRQSASGSLVSSHISQHTPRAKKRRAIRTEPSVAAQFRNTELERVRARTQLLADKELCVITGLPEHSKQQLECRIVEHGGTVVLNPGKTTYCVVVGTKQNVRVSNVCRNGVYDVVRAEWLIRSLEAGELLQWTPADIISATSVTSERLRQQFDQFGDSFTDQATEHSLIHSLMQVGNKNISEKNMLKLDAMIFGGRSPFSIFRGCMAYFDCYEEVGNISRHSQTPLNALMYDFKFRSGKVSTNVINDTTHIVLYSSEFEHLEDLILLTEQLNIRPYIVQHYWIVDCIKQKNFISEEKYVLHKWS